MNSRYRELETLLTSLLTQAALVLTAPEVAEVEQFVNAGEYGVAVETLIAIFRESHRRAPPALFELLLTSLKAMQMDPEELRDIEPQA